jgi:cytochrome c oxidase subunit 1
VIVSLIGGLILLASALLFIVNLLPRRSAERLQPWPGYAYALAVHPPQRVPAALNGFGLWNVLVAVLMTAAYGFPIAQFFIGSAPQALIHRLTGG